MTPPRRPVAALLARLLPSQWSWLRLVASPSSFLLGLGLLLTALGKLVVLQGLVGVEAWPLWVLVVLWVDITLHMGLAALFALGERRSPWLLLATVPMALVVVVLSFANAFYMGMTGEQLSWQGVSTGVERLSDVLGIAGNTLGATSATAWLILASLVGGVPLAAAGLLRWQTGSAHLTRHGADRARAAGLLTAGALLVGLLAPTAEGVPMRRLERGAALLPSIGALVEGGDVPGSFESHRPQVLVDDEEISRLAASAPVNVVVVVLESTRWDATGLAGPTAPAATPALMALAARGTEVTSARAVVPHTTKSVWSMLCGRVPLVQPALYETAAAATAQCLPHVLAAAGYRTAFLQSALGAFEDRPRLVANLGFEHFEAWEDIGGEPLGYLASDDESLSAPLASFIDAGPGPFLAVLLTSATHHPYELSQVVAERAVAAGAPRTSPAERYYRLVEAEDALLADVIALLEARGLADDTIVVALGDHGEGFGEKGVKQHDTNFFDEGLRVPWVLAGPGVPVQRVAGPAALIDLAPTLLDALGVALDDRARAELVSESVLDGSPLPGPRPFGCWFDGKCRGYVDADVKVVLLPDERFAFAFDLAADPDERNPLALDEGRWAALAGVSEIIDAHRTDGWRFELGPVDRYDPWRCPAGQPCVHPNSPPEGLFQPQ